jgi:hypothetical protein
MERTAGAIYIYQNRLLPSINITWDRTQREWKYLQKIGTKRIHTSVPYKRLPLPRPSPAPSRTAAARVSPPAPPQAPAPCLSSKQQPKNEAFHPPRNRKENVAKGKKQRRHEQIIGSHLAAHSPGGWAPPWRDPTRASARLTRRRPGLPGRTPAGARSPWVPPHSPPRRRRPFQIWASPPPLANPPRAPRPPDRGNPSSGPVRRRCCCAPRVRHCGRRARVRECGLL